MRKLALFAWILLFAAPAAAQKTGLRHGGTNQDTWTASRCVQVAADGSKLESASAACGSGGGTHALLSATHSDTTTAAVQRGALITGQGGSPSWSLLVKGSNGSCLVSDGTDIGWSSCAGGAGTLPDLSNLTSPTVINLSTLTFAGAAGITAGGSNQNVMLTPSGIGIVSAAGGSLLVAPSAVYGGDSASADAQVKTGLDVLGEVGVNGGDAVLWLRTASGNAQFLYFVDDVAGWGVYDAVAGKQPLAVAPASPDFTLYIRPAGLSVNTLAAAAANYLCYNTTADVGYNTLSTCSTLPANLLPNPSASTLGGTESLAVVAHKWINTISTSGVPAATQPAFSDVSGAATAAQIPNGLVHFNTSAATPGGNSGTYYYIPNSDVDLPATYVNGVGNNTAFLWHFVMGKTAAGTAAFNIRLLYGTAGTTGDTTIATQSVGTATAVADQLTCDATLAFTSATAAFWSLSCAHIAATGVGFGLLTTAVNVWTGTVSGLTTSTPSLKFGLAYMNTTGTAVITTYQTWGKAFNLD